MSKLVRTGSHVSNKRVAKHHKQKFIGNQFTFKQEISFASTFIEKLKNLKCDDILIEPAHEYVIIHSLPVLNFSNDKLEYKICHNNIKFLRSGECFDLNLMCKCQGDIAIGSSPFINKLYEINRQIVFVVRLLGIGLQV